MMHNVQDLCLFRSGLLILEKAADSGQNQQTADSVVETHSRHPRAHNAHVTRFARSSLRVSVFTCLSRALVLSVCLSLSVFLIHIFVAISRFLIGEFRVAARVVVVIRWATWEKHGEAFFEHEIAGRVVGEGVGWG